MLSWFSPLCTVLIYHLETFTRSSQDLYTRKFGPCLVANRVYTHAYWWEPVAIPSVPRYRCLITSHLRILTHVLGKVHARAPLRVQIGSISMYLLETKWTGLIHHISDLPYEAEAEVAANGSPFVHAHGAQPVHPLSFGNLSSLVVSHHKTMHMARSWFIPKDVVVGVLGRSSWIGVEKGWCFHPCAFLYIVVGFPHWKYHRHWRMS